MDAEQAAKFSAAERRRRHSVETASTSATAPRQEVQAEVDEGYESVRRGKKLLESLNTDRKSEALTAAQSRQQGIDMKRALIDEVGGYEVLKQNPYKFDDFMRNADDEGWELDNMDEGSGDEWEEDPTAGQDDSDDDLEGFIDTAGWVSDDDDDAIKLDLLRTHGGAVPDRITIVDSDEEDSDDSDWDSDSDDDFFERDYATGGSTKGKPASVSTQPGKGATAHAELGSNLVSSDDDDSDAEFSAIEDLDDDDVSGVDESDDESDLEPSGIGEDDSDADSDDEGWATEAGWSVEKADPEFHFDQKSMSLKSKKKHKPGELAGV